MCTVHDVIQATKSGGTLMYGPETQVALKLWYYLPQIGQQTLIGKTGLLHNASFWQSLNFLISLHVNIFPENCGPKFLQMNISM